MIQNHETWPLQRTTNAFKVQTLFREYGNPSRTQPSLLREKFATFQEASTVSNIKCLVQGIADYHNPHIFEKLSLKNQKLHRENPVFITGIGLQCCVACKTQVQNNQIRPNWFLQVQLNRREFNRGLKFRGLKLTVLTKKWCRKGV